MGPPWIPPISKTAANDGNAAKGSLGDGAVKSLLTTLLLIVGGAADLRTTGAGLIKLSLILLARRPGTGKEGEYTDPSASPNMIPPSYFAALSGYSKAVTIGAESLDAVESLDGARDTEAQNCCVRESRAPIAPGPGLLDRVMEGLNSILRPRTDDEGMGEGMGVNGAGTGLLSTTTTLDFRVLLLPIAKADLFKVSPFLFRLLSCLSWREFARARDGPSITGVSRAS